MELPFEFVLKSVSKLSLDFRLFFRSPFTDVFDIFESAFSASLWSAFPVSSETLSEKVDLCYKSRFLGIALEID